MFAVLEILPCIHPVTGLWLKLIHLTVWMNYTATKIPFMYFFSGNFVASVPIYTFMRL